jgi:hypothetical protein
MSQPSANALSANALSANALSANALSANALSANAHPRIISLSGLAGAGKDTVADFLCSQYGYQRISFAAPLKDVCAAIFGWDREMLEGRTKEARSEREVPDTFWSDRLDRPDFSPRRALQELGTDVLRTHFHPDIWLAAFEHRVARAGPEARFVITDCRFENELACLRKLGAAIWWIWRGLPPTWWNAARLGETIPGVHISETLWISKVVGAADSFAIANNGTLAELHQKIVSELIK